MQSLKELYKIGPGPSSSHTLAPKRACLLHIQEFGLLDHYVIELYGSLSLTGKGHMTDKIIIETFHPASVEIKFKLDWQEEFPNGFYIYGYDRNHREYKWTVFSIGGGSIQIKEKTLNYNDDIYVETSFKEIMDICKHKQQRLLDYINDYEPDLNEHLGSCFDVMVDCVKRGLSKEGLLPGPLDVSRCAKNLYQKGLETSAKVEQDRIKLMSYAYAANEENASGQLVVTAPTLGACGVMAAMVYYYHNDLGISKEKIVDGLKIAGIFGNLIKRNASISGACGGCQAEVGSACAMSAALSGFLNGLTDEEIEYAAEIGIEHHLGLTCDPVGGYVIIPCIERNAVAVLRAIDAMVLSKNLHPIKDNRVSFDMVVNTMNYTGKKIAVELRETSLGGLASEFDVACK
ncbi:MAG: L-serine ammonia-lyase, iron-sulfur-dependent, subunit alpha [Erysipelotrichaceae bacterium]|nr:L-serine ammonia-lyase, iron-sulfur-dependent, subunit alpha [Erysipelotrichaceae bacterium]